jgi:hypothetical protein
MATVTFDTLKFAKTLEAAGIPSQQAEAFTEAFRDATSEELVTRDYLDARLEALKVDLLKWVAGMLMAQVAVVAALVKLL